MKTTKMSLFENAGKQLPFTVPENYFDQFALQIETQIGYSHNSSHKLLRPWMYAAAVFIGVLMTSPIIYSNYQTQQKANSDSYESYVLSQVDETVMLDSYVNEPSK